MDDEDDDDEKAAGGNALRQGAVIPLPPPLRKGSGDVERSREETRQSCYNIISCTG